MSLSAWEQQALDSIKDGLAGSDPQLAGLLTTFTRLASGEEMPVQEEILGGSQRKSPRPLRKPRRRIRAGARRHARPMHGRVTLQWVMLLLLLVMTVVLITVTLVLSHGGSQGTHGGSQGTCTGIWPTICSHSAPG
ncbi:MAG TPA: hypothetical protein VIY52_01040 [Streptosporangiaceae bacterium]